MLVGGLQRALGNGVGRKILGLFLAAGVIPVIFTAGLAFNELNHASEARVAAELQQNAKAYGVDILTRLNHLAEKAVVLSQSPEILTNDSLHQHPYLVDDFDAIWFVTADGDKRYILGSGTSSIFSALVDHDFITSGKTQMITIIDQGKAELVFLRRLQSSIEANSLVAYQLRHDRVWGSADEIPFNTEFCVHLPSGLQLHCTQQMSSDLHRLTSVTVEGETVEWTKQDVRHLATSWQLFLNGAFRGPAFDIVASQPRNYALRSSADFRRVFIPALGLVLFLVALLAFNMIGHSLGPLQRLTLAAKEFARGNFRSRVTVESDDEFGALGTAFNDMADRLGAQVRMLEAMSEIDHHILTGGSFGAVCESVVRHLKLLTNSDHVALAVKQRESQSDLTLFSLHSDNWSSETIVSPEHMRTEFRETTIISPQDQRARVFDTAEQFMSGGNNSLAVLPVMLNEAAKGLLLIGAKDDGDLKSHLLSRCEELASRFAVALSSFERETALYRQAHYDDLTGLPNRQLLKERLRKLIVDGRDNNQKSALLYLDLDRFKEINDVYGHSVGDNVLVQAAERITSTVRNEDIVARLGGDEFVVVLQKVSKTDDAKASAEKLLERLTDVFSVFGVNHFVGASIGIVMIPHDGDSVETLLKNADAAMYKAKDAGRARYEFFNIEFNAESRRKIELERDLRAGFANRELELVYQPQFKIDTSELSGAEALLRWKHKEHGYVSPAEFIPLAEESELIVDIGRWVIDQACSDIRMIIDKGLHPGSISINVSARQLRDDRLVTSVLESLRQHQLHPAHLQVEVTETAVAQNRDTVASLLNSLREKCVKVAIDDFGTGYSSLSYLQNLPFDTIKIDKSFVDRILTADSSANICTTIIKMAAELGKTSVAEGVETEEQIDALRQSGCDIVQGYFYSQPLSLQDFLRFIRKLDRHTQRRRAIEVL